jgi:glycosyltransferase involved in cell wall biosynthesis
VSIGLVFENFGPYHLARLRGAAESERIVGIELWAQSKEYAWHRRDFSRDCEIMTVAGTAALDHAEMRRKLIACLAHVAPDVLAVPGWADRTVLEAVRWAVDTRTPLVVMSESAAGDAHRYPWREWFKRQIVKCFGAALVGGRPQAQYLRHLGMPENRTFIGYDAVDNAYFTAGASETKRRASDVRSKYGLPERYFLASARFVPKKNLPQLIKAFAHYRATFQAQGKALEDAPWDLVVIGDGPMMSEIRGLCSELKVDRYVHLPGFRQYQDLPSYYGLAGAFIHTSTVEQWGLVVNEALASELPVLVAASCGCAQDLVEESGNGFTFDPLDSVSMAELMSRISRISDAERSAMGRRGRAIVEEFGPEAFGRGLQAAARAAQLVGPTAVGLASRLSVAIKAYL